MPHFIIDCSENIIEQESPKAIMEAVHDVANATGLFAVNDIKVRLRPYHYFKLGKAKEISFTFLDTLWKAEAPNKKRTSQEE
jgi:5-carboxymethyl-2-hydroxymuconate isomerase